MAWLCLPRFDSPPLFCSVLDHTRGGAFRIVPDGLRESAQCYEPDSAVLVTEMRCAEGSLRIRDCCPVIAGADLSEDISVTRRELLRSVTVTEGTIRLTIEMEPRGGAEAEPREGGLRIRCKAQPERWRSEFAHNQKTRYYPTPESVAKIISYTGICLRAGLKPERSRARRWWSTSTIRPTGSWLTSDPTSVYGKWNE